MQKRSNDLQASEVADSAKTAESVDEVSARGGEDFSDAAVAGGIGSS